MKNRWATIWILSLTLAVAAMLLTAPCAKAAPVKEIKIGFILPLSGAHAPTGKALREGAELAADIINNRYPELGISIAQWKGIPNLGGAKIKLIFADHRGDAAWGADQAKRLIED